MAGLLQTKVQTPRAVALRVTSRSQEGGVSGVLGGEVGMLPWEGHPRSASLG